MNRLLLLLLLHIFLAPSVKSQDYIETINISFADSTNHFGLERFQDHKTQLYGYRKGLEIVIPAKYNFTNGFSKKGIARVTLNSSKNPFANASSLIGTYTSMDMILDNGGLNGFIDTLGNIVVPIKYSVLGALEMGDVVAFSIYEQSKGMMVKKYGLINDKGEEVVEAKYSHIVQNGKIFIASRPKEGGEDKYLYLDSKGKELGKDEMFDKFKILNQGNIQMFYVEHNETGYILDQNFKYCGSLYIGDRSEKEVMQRLFEIFVDYKESSLNRAQEYYDNLIETEQK